MKNLAWVAVAFGGFWGAVCRYSIQKIHFVNLEIPLNIVFVNLFGAFVLSCFLQLALDRLILKPVVRTGISTGFLGAFTTFSTFCAESVHLLKASNWLESGLYISVSLVGGIIAVWLGLFTAKWLSRKAGGHYEY